MDRKSTLLAAVFAVVLAPAVSSAGTIFSDNFDSESLGLNYNAFANWDVTDGTVDLIGSPGPFDFLPGNGRYVDLDGSTGNAGILTTKPLFGAGSYVLTFRLAGNRRDASPETVRVSYGTDSRSYSLGFAAPFTPYSIDFVASAPFRISFANAGGDNVGMLLDGVALNDASAVPEPGTLLLLGSGISALGLRRRRSAR